MKKILALGTISAVATPLVALSCGTTKTVATVKDATDHVHLNWSWISGGGSTHLVYRALASETLDISDKYTGAILDSMAQKIFNILKDEGAHRDVTKFDIYWNRFSKKTISIHDTQLATIKRAILHETFRTTQAGVRVNTLSGPV